MKVQERSADYAVLIQPTALHPLGELIKPTRPRVKPLDKPHLPFIGMEHIEAHTMRLLGTVPASTMKSSAVHFQPGDVLYGRLRPYLNKVYRPDFEGLCSAEFIVFPRTENLDSRYLQYFLNSSEFVSYATHLNAGDRPRVDFDQLAPYPFPVRPLDQQKRIVAEIEKQFSRLDEAVANLKRVKANLKRYKAAVLKAAVEGKLTEAWRKQHPDTEPASELLQHILAERRAKWEQAELAKMQAKGKTPKDDAWKKKYPEPAAPGTTDLPELPEGWVWTSVNQLVAHLTDGDHQPPPQTDQGIPFLVIGNVRSGEINFLDTRFVGEDYYNSLDPNHQPKKGDLLYTLVGSYGIPVRVTTDKPFCIQRHMAILRPHGKSPMAYLTLTMGSDNVFKQATAVATGTAQLTVPLTGLRRIAIPLPPLTEQQRIVAEVDRCLSLIRETEAEVDANLKRAERLRQSILSGAFTSPRCESNLL